LFNEAKDFAHYVEEVGHHSIVSFSFSLNRQRQPLNKSPLNSKPHICIQGEEQKVNTYAYPLRDTFIYTLVIQPSELLPPVW
jgi:hypothetical protein